MSTPTPPSEPVIPALAPSPQTPNQTSPTQATPEASNESPAPVPPPVPTPTPMPTHVAPPQVPNTPTATASDADLDQQLAEAMGDASMDDIMDTAGDTTPNASSDASSTPDTSGTPGTADTTDNTAASQDANAGQHEQLDYVIKRGRIAAVRGDDVFVELTGIDGKNQGLVPLTQFDRPPRPGSIMDFVVERFDEKEGLIILSREGAISITAWDQLRKGSIIDARCTGTNKGGLELELVGGIRAFMPASQVDIHHIENLEPYVGEKIAAMVQEIDRRGKKVLLSRRRYLEHEREKNAKKLWAELQLEQVRTGTVVRLVEFGAFVDIGGIDGLLHVSDMSHARVGKPSDVVKEGQTVEVKILKLDPEKGRISLGLKQTMPDPWLDLQNRVTVGEQVSGRVVKLTNFGAFIEIETGVEGLLPVSEMSWKRIHQPSQVVSEGDVIKLAVIAIDPQKKRLTFSLKQITDDPWAGAAQTYARNELVEGKVVRITDFGAFIELTEGVEGLVHISELSDRRVNQVGDVLTEGESKQFRVLDIDPDEHRIRLSLKAVDAPLLEGTAEDAAAAAKKRAPRKRPDQLKGGMEGASLGMGLGNLKL